MTTLLIPRYLFVTIINALPKDTWGAYARPEGIELTLTRPELLETVKRLIAERGGSR